MTVQSAAGTEFVGSAGGSELLLRKPQTFWSMALGTLRRDRLTLAALGFILLIALLAVGAGGISRALGVDQYSTNLANKFQAPYLFPYIEWRLGTDTTTAPEMLFNADGVPHWFGTDQLGRDLLSRLLYGARISLSIAIIAAAIAMVLGVFFGTIAGYFGGRTDDTFMWLINTVTSIPEIYLLIIVNAIFRPNAITLTLFLGFLGWFGTARFMRGNVLKVRMLDYTLAARSIGANSSRIMWTHIIPNCIPVIIVITFIDVGALILTESVLSFLGVGVPPPTPSWGNMLQGANEYLTYRDPVTHSLAAIHLVVLPGILTMLTVLSFYLIGDGLRDALDPMLKNKK
jgi:ABC-type dipeptide/oligopeptide/nickel transport system permease subunit